MPTSKTKKSSKTRDNKFGIDTIQFPDYLGTKELNQYILFNINIRGKSELDKNKIKKGAEVVRTGSAQMGEEALATSRTGSEVSGSLAVAATVVGNERNKAIATAQRSAGTPRGVPLLTGLFKGAVAGLGTLAVIKVIGSQKILEQDTSYRISDAIALYINDPPTVKYSTQYDNKDLGTMAGTVGSISGVDSAGGTGGGVGEGAAALLTAFAKVPQQAGFGAPADIIGATAKVGLNPFKEVLFQTVDFRSFTFKYRFLPKNQKEADTVKEIIDTFKYHMHPELSKNKLFFIYPSEFQISYVYQKKENEYFHRFKPCVLESLDVTYGGEQYSSFTDGKPTEVNLSMLFRETEILTKQQVSPNKQINGEPNPGYGH